MAIRYCEMCGAPVDGDGQFCANCEKDRTKTEDNHGCAVSAFGCALPIILSVGSLLLMFTSLGCSGGSGMVVFEPFVIGLVLGTPIFIYGLVLSRRSSTPKDEDTPPPVL